MADVLSYETGANTGGTSVTVGSGLGGVAVGNLLVAQYIWNNTSGTTTAPASWTKLFTEARGGSLGCSSEIWWKVADSGDASSPSFTFSNSSGTKGRLSVIKIQAGQVVTPIPQSSTRNDNSVNPMTGTAITPSIANSLLLMFTTTGSGADGSPRTVSGYAIATSNPTWTELYDTGNGNFNSVACAYAVRPETTSTGTPSANQEVSGADYLFQFIAVAGAYTTSPADTQATSDVNLSKISIFPSGVITLADSIIARLKLSWNNLTKNTSTWINRDK